ncbi:MAG: OmpA family protein [Desulfobacterales bacterium]
MTERSDTHKYSFFNLQFSIITSGLCGFVTLFSKSGINRHLWVGVLIFHFAFSGSSLAMDCRLGEKYYFQAKSAIDPIRITEWLQQSIAVCPNFNAWYMLGLLYKNQGQINEAIDAFDQAGENAGTPKLETLALARQGELLAQTGQSFQALRALRAAKRFYPEPAPDWLEKSLKNARIQSFRVVMPAEEIASFLEIGTQSNRDRRFAVRPGVNIPVQFDFDRFELNSRGILQITELGEALTKEKMRSWSFLLVGHTDKRGPPAYNQVLSEKRAHTVKMELERRFPSLIQRLKTEGRGETELLYDGDTESDHMLNRRVKVTLTRSTGPD